MSVLTTSQLTFCDLKDSYSIHVDTECIGVPCNNNGLVIKDQTATINYRAFTGSTLVGASCEVSNLPSGVTLVSKTYSSGNQDGSIVLNISKDATLNNEVTSNMKVVFKTSDSEQFVFEKYITFVKSVAGYDGTDAVNFQIYSVDGFEFNDSLTSIELKTAVFQGGNPISSGVTYQWFWWNVDKYEAILDFESVPITSPTLTVDVENQYAFASLKCVITYDGLDYEDYVSLTKKTIVYTSVVKFFDGSNIFTSNDLYIVAYVELYQNNNRIESALDAANSYYSGISSVSSDGVITTSLSGDFSDGDRIYFIYRNNNLYSATLGEYTSGVWNVVDNDCKYVYQNSLYSDVNTNIVVISKESINKAQNIDFIIYDGNTEISRTNINVIDSNDPIIGDEMPENPTHNQLWLDTSVTPNILKIYDQSNNQWLDCSDYEGNTIYTSQPSSYYEGDLWILADGETCGDFGPGSMLKATTTTNSFNSSHWIDADKSLTNLKDNINQYFAFDVEDGLKIGQRDENFYVKISSTEMGFYDNSNVQHKKVVHISNETANIDGLTVEKNLHVDCPATFNDEVNFLGFVWKKELNGSLSLAIGS